MSSRSNSPTASSCLPEFQIGQADPKKTVRKPELAFEVEGDSGELADLIKSEYQRVVEPFKAAQLASLSSRSAPDRSRCQMP